MNVTNPLANTSYTNRDFQTIFEELLGAVHTLTSKWDPIAYGTNESDPGIVLIKLIALLGDKLNYNIDKNVLECFPLSVTQEGNARQLYRQLGYNMAWYRSATTTVTMNCTDTSIGVDAVTIPKFTMVSDEENTMIYTLLSGDLSSQSQDDFNVQDMVFPLDGNSVSFRAIQGIAYNYSLNGETTIQAYHLDADNRLYFDARNVPENGVFITNIFDDGSTNYENWKRKDNLLVEKLNNTYYSFGVTSDGTQCYIEFPEDAENIFKNGIKIVYIKTKGSDGNIVAETIEKFYTDLVIGDVTLTIDNVKMYNANSATNGSDPESINNAFKSFRRVVGTFDTLITLRDYTNYLIANGDTLGVSNGFACDRTNDIQTVYNIMTLDNSINTLVPTIERDVEDNPCVTAFDLKLYFFGKPEYIDSQEQCNKSFDLLRYSEPQKLDGEIKYDEYTTIHAYIADIKSIPHDYSPILPTTDTHAHICCIKNVYPIKCTVYTKSALTDSQVTELRDTIIKPALWSSLNSAEVDFSQNISTANLCEIIKNADNRINNVVMNDINYTTYAVYYDEDIHNYITVPINGDDLEYITYSNQYKDGAWDKFVTTKTYYEGDVVVNSTNTEKWVCTKKICNPAATINERNWKRIDTLVVLTGDGIDALQKKIGYGNYYDVVAELTDSKKKWKVTIDDGGSGITETILRSELPEKYGIDIILQPKDDGSSYAKDDIKDGDKFTFRPSKALQIRDEIVSKSILAGTSPLYQQTEEFDYQLSQILDSSDYTDGIWRNIKSVKTSDEVTFSNGIQHDALRANESIQFIAPNLIQSDSYSNYVKIASNLSKDVAKNVSRRLEDGEWVALFWKASDDDTLYSYKVYFGCDASSSQVKYWMCPTYDMAKGVSCPDASISGYIEQLQVTKPDTNVISNVQFPLSQTISDTVGSKMYDKKYLLSGTKSLAVKKKNEFTVDNQFYLYWILTEKQVKDKGYVYHMFSKTPDDEKDGSGHILPDGTIIRREGKDVVIHPSYQEYILGSGEYLLYLKGTLSKIGVLGAGTTIRRDVIYQTGDDQQKYSYGFTTDWEVKADVTLNDINADGYLALQNSWYQITPEQESVHMVENQLAVLSEGTKITMGWDSQHASTLKITTDIVDLSAIPVTDIHYTPTGSTESYDLKDIIDNFNELKARALLGLSVSSKEEQPLYSGQTLYLYDEDSDIVPLKQINGADVTGGKYPTVIQCTSEIVCDGTSKQDIFVTDENGDVTYPDMYLYARLEDKSNVVYANDGDTTMTFSLLPSLEVTVLPTPSEETYGKIYLIKVARDEYKYYKMATKESTSFTELGQIHLSDEAVAEGVFVAVPITLSFKIPPTETPHNGMYLVALKTSSTTLGGFSMRLNNTRQPLLNSDETDFSENNNSGRYCYVNFSVPPTGTGSGETMIDNLKFEFASSNNEGTVQVTVSNPFRWKTPDTMTDEAYDKYLSLVGQLDNDGLFDYTYQISDDNLIADPLEAVSFFKSNHILYDFTIAQLGTVESSSIAVQGEN